MVDVDKSLVSQNGGFVLIYRHFHLPFKLNLIFIQLHPQSAA